MLNYGYDIETYPNVFTFSCECIETGDKWYYEISEYRNDLHELMTFLYALRDSNANMVGFNNIGFDYPVIHFILERLPTWAILTGKAVVAYIYEKAMTIINTSWHNRFDNIIWQPIIKQLDLLKIRHFDNEAMTTSLKILEFNMRSINIRDLPFTPGTYLTFDQIPILATYNRHDVSETIKFFHHTKPMIDFRAKLSEKYNKDFMNHNDTKIGKDYFIMRLEEHAPGTCYWYDENNKRQPRQTGRDGVPCADIIFSYIKFRRAEFKQALEWLKNHTIYETKGKLGLSAVIDGFSYDFGTGGIHGSVTAQSVYADDDYAIIDLDVASFYPNIAIVNKLYPEHLGEAFCDIYKDVYEQRRQHAKGTPENAMLKLALNGVYGDSNSLYSVFYDPKYTMSITINGQLLLCMLAEKMLDLPGLLMIQINTDGLTVKVPRGLVPQVGLLARQWEKETGLELEDINYSAMHIRDVNNYIGVYEDGKLKLKGDYDSRLAGTRFDVPAQGWHQNHSAMIVPLAAKAALVDGIDIAEFITSPERDIMDFMLRTKTPHASKLVLVDGNRVEHPQQGVTRYFVAHRGGKLVKLSPPTKPHTVGTFKKKQKTTDAKYFEYDPMVWNGDVHTKNQSKNKERRDGITVGWNHEVCNDIRFINGSNLNHAYYITEAKKLVDCIK